MIYHKVKVTVAKVPKNDTFEFLEFSSMGDAINKVRQTLRLEFPKDFANGQAATVPISQGFVKFKESMRTGQSDSIIFVWRTKELADQYLAEVNTPPNSKYFTATYEGTVDESELFIDTEDL